MKSKVFRQRVTADANHTIHVTLPPEMGDEVEIVVVPSVGTAASMSAESLVMAQLMDETGFAKNVLDSPEEDCWNAL
ncbi:MAG: hypothetical protein AB7I68_08550 [Porticoccaceae bacterium]